MESDLLIHNGTIVTVNSDFDVIQNGYLTIRNGDIHDIAPAKNTLPQAKEVINAKGGIIMPGLVNSHTHLPMTLFRGLADDLPLHVWLTEHMFPAEASMIRSETAYTGALLGCAEMILSGTTTCCDGYFHEHDVAKAVLTAGVRAVLAQGVIDFPVPGVPDPNLNVESAMTFADHWKNQSPLIRPSFFCHSPYTCSAATLKRAKSETETRGILFQIHVAETQSERDQITSIHGKSPVAYLESLGLLNERTLIVHAVWADDDDIRIIRRNDTSISHTPQSNMKLASGIAPVEKFIKAGIPVGLGTDGAASNNSLDMFREMDMAAKLHKVIHQDPTLLDARTVIRMATIESAKVIGWSDRIGSLEIGKAADIIVLNTQRPHLTPLYTPESHLVYAVRGADVIHTIINGKTIMKDRNMLTIDVDALIDRVVASCQKIKNRQP